MADEDQTLEATQYRDIMRHRALADALRQKAGDTSPTRSKWEGLSRAILPLIGALLKNKADSQYAQLSDAAMPEYSAMAQSDNPVAIAAASKNPLIRAMLPQLAQLHIQGAMGAQNKGLETTAIGNAKLSYEPKLTAANEQAKGGPAIETAVGTEKGTLPYKKILAYIQASKPIPVPQGGQLVNPMTGEITFNGAAHTDESGPWTDFQKKP